MTGPGARVASAVLVAAAAAAALAAGGKADKADLKKALGDNALVGDWIYDDIDAGFARALKEKKPVCIVFR